MAILRELSDFLVFNMEALLLHCARMTHSMRTGNPVTHRHHLVTHATAFHQVSVVNETVRFIKLILVTKLYVHSL